jgi:hypothetical protein
MTPESIRSLIPQYLAGTLPPPDRELLESQMDRDAALQTEVESLQTLWQDLGLLPAPEPSAALRAHFYQKLNAVVKAKPDAVRAPWWKRAFVPQIAAACSIFLLGLGAGQLNFKKTAPQPNEISQLRTQVEGLRETVALSLLDKQSASSRLQGVSWGSQIDRPDQELLDALLATLNHDQNINVRLASLDALEKFTSDAAVRKALENSIPAQESPLLQIALIDSLVHIRDNAAAKEFKQLSGDTAVNAAVRQRARWGLQKLNFE